MSKISPVFKRENPAKILMRKKPVTTPLKKRLRRRDKKISEILKDNRKIQRSTMGKK